MTVIAINGSPHEKGSTAAALGIMARVLEDRGITVETVHIGKEPIQGCTGCGGCRKGGLCVFDDMVNDTASRLRQADGVILGAPTYYGGIAGGAKSFYDRLFYIGPGLKAKPGAAVTVARRSGGEDTFHQLSSYLTLAGAVIAPTTYWNVIHGHNGREILADTEGVSILESAAESMAWLLRMIDATRDSIPAPALRKDVATNFIR